MVLQESKPYNVDTLKCHIALQTSTTQSHYMDASLTSELVIKKSVFAIFTLHVNNIEAIEIC